MTEIPKLCKAGVIKNCGPDFTISVEMVPVPEPGKGVSTNSLRDPNASFDTRIH